MVWETGKYIEKWGLKGMALRVGGRWMEVGVGVGFGVGDGGHSLVLPAHGIGP